MISRIYGGPPTCSKLGARLDCVLINVSSVDNCRNGVHAKITSDRVASRRSFNLIRFQNRRFEFSNYVLSIILTRGDHSPFDDDSSQAGEFSRKISNVSISIIRDRLALHDTRNLNHVKVRVNSLAEEYHYYFNIEGYTIIYI